MLVADENRIEQFFRVYEVLKVNRDVSHGTPSKLPSFISTWYHFTSLFIRKISTEIFLRNKIWPNRCVCVCLSIDIASKTLFIIKSSTSKKICQCSLKFNYFHIVSFFVHYYDMSTQTITKQNSAWIFIKCVQRPEKHFWLAFYGYLPAFSAVLTNWKYERSSNILCAKNL